MTGLPVAAPPRAKRHGCAYYFGLVLVALFVLLIIGLVINELEEVNRTPQQKEAKEKDAAKLSIAVAGANKLRGMMRNPDSFKLNQVLVMDDNAVCYSYRAQNGFGGMNAGHAVLSPNGTIRTTEASGFATAWNTECAHRTGADETWGVGYALGLHGIFSDK